LYTIHKDCQDCHQVTTSLYLSTMTSLNFHTLLTSISPSANSEARAITIPSNPPLHLTYAQLAQFVDSFSQELKQIGVSGGQVVSLSLVNSLEFVGGFLATGWIRAVSAPLNPAYSQDEIEFYLNDTKSSVLLVKGDEADDERPTIKAAKKCRVKVVTVTLSSSGNGQPKIVLKTIFDPSSSGGNGPTKETTRMDKAAQPPDYKLIDQAGKGAEGGIANKNQSVSGSVEEQDVALVLHTVRQNLGMIDNLADLVFCLTERNDWST
jgi:acyl-CoA synthetase (AMP-forming)/AMP-acid ligase II